MSDFQETARIRIKDLSSKSAAVRREAAYFLGEAGIDEAITKLAILYKSDPDKSVRKAAAYALGMFRAVELELQKGNEEKVVGLLREVLEEGKLGHRRKTGGVRVMMVLLLVVFVGLVAANLLLPGLKPIPGIPTITLPQVADSGGGGGEAASTDRASIVEGMRFTYEGVNNDLTRLQDQFRLVLTGGQLHCGAFFDLRPAYEFPAGAAGQYPELAVAAQTLNAAQAAVMAGHTRFDQACNQNMPLEIAEVGSQLAPLVAAADSLKQVEPMFADASTATPEATPLPPTETPIPPTPTPTVIVPVADVRSHLGPLYGIIDLMRTPRGPNRLLRQYWIDARDAGSVTACELPPPEIPEDYVLPQIDAEASIELKQAVDTLNTALKATRDSWQLFRAACDSNTVPQQAANGLARADAVDASLDLADDLLDVVRNSA